MRIPGLCAALLLIASAWLPADAERPDSIGYGASVIANASSGDWAPYMIGSWNLGRNTPASGAWLDIHAGKDVNRAHRFSWGAGFEAIAGAGTKAEYERYDATSGKWFDHKEGQAAVRIIQLWGELKYRGVFLSAGMKPESSPITTHGLSSGDLILSDNARPIPAVTAGFIDFQDIPFTQGWVQIEGRIAYGRTMDSKFKQNRYNYYEDLIASDLCYTYKRCYFRTKPTERFYVTLGMQAAGFFGGNTEFYRNGTMVRREDRGFHIKDLWEMFFPKEGSGESFYKGSSLGSWDFRADYRIPGAGHSVAFYFEWPWEDGSGIGRRNGWDGLWGLEYRAPAESWVDGAVFEFLDFTNQSGPLHWAVVDNPGTSIVSPATGGDNYFNNDFYGPWSNYGLALGNAFMLAPLYNHDGHWEFAHNRTRGFHTALTGRLLPTLRYRAMLSYQKAWGEGRRPINTALHDTSAMLEATWQRMASPWSARLQLALDHGTLRGNNFGASLTVSYSGALSFKKK